MDALDRVFIIIALLSLLLLSVIHDHKPQTECWTNTFPNKTHTWHPIRCPEGVGK